MSVFQFVTAVVQFDRDQRTQRLRIAQHEVDVLAINPVRVGAVLLAIARLRKEQVAQAHLGTDLHPAAHDRPQHLVETQFGGGQEVLPEAIRKRVQPGRRFVLRRQPVEDALHDVVDGLGGQAQSGQHTSQEGVAVFGVHAAAFPFSPVAENP